MELIIIIILATVFFIGILLFIIENRKSLAVLFTSFLIYLGFVTLGVASHYKIQPLMLFISEVFFITFFGIPILFEFYERTKQKQNVSSKDFILNYNLESSYGIPDNINDELLEVNCILDPLNSFSCFYYKTFNDCLYDRKALFLSSNYEGAITCSIKDLKFYLIDRCCVFKVPRGKRRSYYREENSFYEEKDFVCIIESETPVKIPDFLLRDRIPFIDTMRYCLDFFDKKYINFNHDRDFSNKYVIEASDSKGVKDYFGFKIREAFKKNQLKDVTMLYSDNRLLVRFPYLTSIEEKRKLFCIICALFKKDVDIFNKSKEISVLKNNKKEEGTLFDYFKDSEGNVSIPPFLGGLIIFIMSLIVIALIGKYM